MNAASERRIGILMSYANIILQAGINFLYVPMLLFYIGQAEYGLYQLIGSLIAYFGVMDFGLSVVVVRFYARYRALGDRRSMENILAIAQLLFAVVAVLALAIGGVCYYQLDTIFAAGLSAGELAEAHDIFVLLLVNIAVTLLTMVYNAVINAEERFLVLKGLGTVQLVLQPVLVLLLLHMSPTAYSVALAQTMLGCALSLYRIYYCYSRLGVRLHYHYIDHALIADFRLLALSVFIAAVVDQIFYRTNQVVLGVIAGTTEVAVYAVAAIIYMSYAMLSTAIVSVYLPHLSALVAQKVPVAELTALFIKVGRWQYYLLALVLTGFTIFGREFIVMWAGEDFVLAYYMTLLMIAPFTVNLIQNLGLSILQAQNKMFSFSVIYVCVGIAQLGLSIYLGLKWGAIGCAAATGIVIFFGKGIGDAIIYSRVIGIDVIRFWRSIARITVFVLVATLGGLGIDAVVGRAGVMMFALKVALYVLLYVAIIYRLAMNNEERSKIRALI